MAIPIASKPVFVDCRDDISVFLTPETREIVPDLDIFFGSPRDEDQLIERLQGRTHALIYMAYVSERVLSTCPDLEAIVYLSTGLATHIDLDAAGRTEIRIEGVRAYGDRAVAEHAIGLAFDALKKLSVMDREIRHGAWRLKQGRELGGKTFGLIGLGGIGSETARMAAALGCRVVGWNRSRIPSSHRAEILTFDEVLTQSDILSLHLALTPETINILGSAEISRMKPGAILINTARAQLVNEQALCQALGDGRIEHAALDVFHEEPLPPDHPMTGMENITLSAHSGWFTAEAIGRLLERGFQQLADQLAPNGGTP